MPIPPFHATLESRTLLQRPAVLVTARAELPTKHGKFDMYAFETADGRKLDDVAIVRGAVQGERAMPARVHSECLTGDVLGSNRCDCGEQLQLALRRFVENGQGILLYLRQEGRGIGIANKVHAYALQDRGWDTVDANRHLGFDDDLRSYETAAAILDALGVVSIELHTNNPRKLEGLRQAGVDVVHRVALQTVPRKENRRYLATKRDRSGHLLDLGQELADDPLE